MLTLTRTRTLPIGLHLGLQSATLAQLVRDGDGWELHALAQGQLPVNENATADEQDREVAAALRQLVVDHHFKGRNVVSCLGSQQLFVQNVRLPKLPPEEIEKVVHTEAEERLPFPIAEAEIRHLMAGEVRQDAAVKQEVILLGCHQGVINRHIHLLEQAGLVPVAIDVEPCALLRCLHTDDETAGDARQLYLHVGERTTAVIIAEGRQILFLKYINSGSTNFDAAVARHLDISMSEAAQMRSAVALEPIMDSSDEVHRSIVEALREPLETMCMEIELCLRYYKVTFRGHALERIVLAGNEATNWLADYLADRYGMPCEPANPFAALKQAPTIDLPGRWAAAMGLALKRAEK